MKRIALALLKFYQKAISPGLPHSCRFVPSCSEYAYRAIEKYGLWKGAWMGIRRLCRCNPLHPGGYDPVP